MSEANVTSEAESRTSLHILGAFGIGVFMAIVLALIPLQQSRHEGGIIRRIQRGAEGDLGLLARAETEFKKRNGFYTTDLNALAVAPKNVLYKIGFVTPSQKNTSLDHDGFVHQPELKDLDAMKAAIPKLEVNYSPVTKLASIDFAAAGARWCTECTATVETFKALAVANLDDDADLDVWTIDEKGELRHLNDDLASNEGVTSSGSPSSNEPAR